MLAMAGALELQATSVDRSVLDALDYVREVTALTRDHIPDRVPVPPGNSIASLSCRFA